MLTFNGNDYTMATPQLLSGGPTSKIHTPLKSPIDKLVNIQFIVEKAQNENHLRQKSMHEPFSPKSINLNIKRESLEESHKGTVFGPDQEILSQNSIEKIKLG